MHMVRLYRLAVLNLIYRQQPTGRVPAGADLPPSTITNPGAGDWHSKSIIPRMDRCRRLKVAAEDKEARQTGLLIVPKSH